MIIENTNFLAATIDKSLGICYSTSIETKAMGGTQFLQKSTFNPEQEVKPMGTQGFWSTIPWRAVASISMVAIILWAAIYVAYLTKLMGAVPMLASLAGILLSATLGATIYSWHKVVRTVYPHQTV